MLVSTSVYAAECLHCFRHIDSHTPTGEAPTEWRDRTDHGGHCPAPAAAPEHLHVPATEPRLMDTIEMEL